MTRLLRRTAVVNGLRAVVACSALCLFGLMANSESAAQEPKKGTVKPAPSVVPSARSATLQEAVKRLRPEERSALGRAQRVATGELKFKLKTDPEAWECDGGGNCSCMWSYDCVDMFANAGCKSGTFQCGWISCECNKK